MKVLIIEDEQPAAKRLSRLIVDLRPGVDVRSIDSVEDAVDYFQKGEKADLVFMDIQLADGISFDIFAKTTVNAPVIFTTAYDHYALKAFKVNSIDYLLKPIEVDELKHAIEKFDKMLKAKNVSSGLSTIRSLQRCLYDMNLYDKYNPENPISTDKLWQDIDKQLGVMNFYVENTHPQASWIHINTHPVYFYGYLWSNAYAQDMFTEFEKNGLKDLRTGMRYRELILANGTQRDIVEAVTEFLGRPSNNKAYIKSLGLDY